MQPLVTLLVPTYNRAQYLREAIESALRQTYENLEIFVLDDASPDNTPQVVEPYLKDPRIRYYRHPANVGIMHNWQYGIENLKGKYFSFLHDDDTLEPTFVEKLVAPLEADEDMILSCSDHWVTFKDGKRNESGTEEFSRHFKRAELPPGRIADFAHATLIDGTVPITACMIRRKYVTSDFVSPEAKGASDAWLLYQCARTGHGAYYVPERLANYREHGGGMSYTQPIYMAEGHLFRQRAVLADPTMERLREPIRHQMADVMTSQGINLLCDNRPGEARPMLKEALGIERSRRALISYMLTLLGPIGVMLARRLRNH